MSDLFLGVDGGQSSTTALIADVSGRILGRGTDGPCNHVSGTEAELKFQRVIGGCLTAACAQAGLDAATISFHAACLGFSGGAQDKNVFVHQLIRSKHIHTTDDGEIAWAGALQAEPGIIVVSGTGSIAYGQNGKGQAARAGGWGYVFGDEGGAFDLVRRALRAALQHEEGWGEATELRGRLLSATGAASVNEAMHAFYTPTWPRSRVAALAPLVTETAASGDTVAHRVLADAARGLSAYPAGVFHRLFETPVPVAAVGGTWAAACWWNAFAAAVMDSIQCTLIQPKGTPAEGALLLARKLTRLS